MAGLFIEEGPIVQVKGRQGKPQLHIDTDPDIQWDGPLVVLVNSFSASASEIFAAAIQDYNRGVVIGSGQSTYGKGTVQRFVDLDRTLANDYSEIKPLGSLKLTIQKFYRIDGGATQLKGVVPDIILPDAYSEIELGEKLLDNVMPWSEISSLDYDDYSKLNADIKSIQGKSQERISREKAFEVVKESALKLKENRDDTSDELNLESFREQQAKLKEEADKIETIDEIIESISVSNLEADKATMGTDEASKDRNDKWIEELQKDFYVYEALQVLKDYVN